MARSERIKSVASSAQRTLRDEYVQDQLQQAAVRLRQAYTRARRQPKTQAVEDKKIYGLVRQAATSLRDAGVAAQRKKPEPKRRGRKILLIAALAGGAAIALKPGRAKLKGILAPGSPITAAEQPANNGASEPTPITEPVAS